MVVKEEMMIAKKRTEIIFMMLTMIVVLVGRAYADGEWATDGDDIYIAPIQAKSASALRLR